MIKDGVEMNQCCCFEGEGKVKNKEKNEEKNQHVSAQRSTRRLQQTHDRTARVRLTI